MFFHYHQNNSFGRYHSDDMLGANLIIEANNEDHADRIFKELTYASNFDSCPCCGDRWTAFANEVDAEDMPTAHLPNDYSDGYVSDVYSKDLRIHYLDGRVTHVHEG